MQFVINGPDIPDLLLQAHEEGRVVFFCGAGVSYPAGLPGFKDLVLKIYELTHTVFQDDELQSFEHCRFDATLDLLERRLPGRRVEVRRALMQALKPRLRRQGATNTQAALLRLARNREGVLRLVTTNFDRVFHAAARRASQAFQAYAAPMLPIPKNSRWNGVVYLHGLLPERPDDTELNRLVVTSGDFGLAYLTERWAARFVSELFRNYVVCFVGYSINDPVLRYMMDALAADRMLGEVTPQAWALGDYVHGQQNSKIIEWKAKGVTPILYEVPAGSHDHSTLHQTLQAWADTHRDGVQGKEAIVVRHALARPQDSTRQDDFVGRMLWALSDPSGLPARRFAHFDPVPSLDWLLEAFADERFKHGDLSRFGVQSSNEMDVKLRFSLIRRPSPYNRAPPMLLVAEGQVDSRWDKVMMHLGCWLVRHLNDPRLVIWLAQHGGQLHDNLLRLVEDQLHALSSIEREGKTAELDSLRSQAPNAIPSQIMRTLWRLLLNNRVRSSSRNHGLYRWKERFEREPLSATLRLDLRDMLAPKLVLSKPLHWGEEEASEGEPTRLRQLVDRKLVLAVDDVHSVLKDLGEQWTSALPTLLNDFQQLLLDALDLLRDLGEADDRNDRSHWDLPSITPHPQNRGFRAWVSLVELLRDAWLTVQSRDRDRATRIAQAWFELPYPTFKRLAFFAASQDNCIPPHQWVDWLLADEACWLWSTGSKREVFRLFVLQGRQLSGGDRERLEAAILAGPPLDGQDNLDADWRQRWVARSVWLRLFKLNASGHIFGKLAAARLAELAVSYPEWQLEVGERNEFSIWTSSTGDPDFEASRNIDIAPRKRRELVPWLAKPPSGPRPSYEDNWAEVCSRHFFQSLCALCDLGQAGVWPAERWREALQTWAGESMASRSWRFAAPLVWAMPDATLQEIVHAVAWWLEAASKFVSCHEDVLIDLCHRILTLPLEAGVRLERNGKPIYQPVTEAINHPVGHVAQALVKLWFKREPNDNDLLPADIAPLFTHICDVQVDRFRHGRVLLASHLIPFFRVDREWTQQYLLPLFSWNEPAEAKAAWEGFLWSPRLYQPLLTAFKLQLLESANHYADLGEHSGQFAAFLTYVSLGPIEGYSTAELRSAVSALPPEGLEQSAEALVQALEGAAGQREDYWRNRVKPFWEQIWPKSRELATPRLAESLTRLVIASRGEFPAALAAVQHWLQPPEYPDFTTHLLHDSGLCRQFPTDALLLLDLIIADQLWVPRELAQCLGEIEGSMPSVMQDTRYRRLREYSRRQAI